MNIKHTLVRGAILSAFVAPLAIYVWTFGTHISPNHARWSEFGSAMSGVYTPILAFLTLAVLVRQLQIQQQLEKHEYDQAYLLQARSESDFYIDRLEGLMEANMGGAETARTLLHHHFEYLFQGELGNDAVKKLALDLNRETPQIVSYLSGVYGVLAGLSTSQERPYLLYLSAVKQKLSSVLGYGTCVTLENYHYLCTDGRVGVQYAFSHLLRPDKTTVVP